MSLITFGYQLMGVLTRQSQLATTNLLLERRHFELVKHLTFFTNIGEADLNFRA